MRTTLPLTACAIAGLVTTGLAASPAAGQPTGGQTSYIVTFRAGTDPAAQAAAARRKGWQVGATLSHVFPGLVVRLTATQADAMRRDPSVLRVEADRTTHTASVQSLDDPGQWGLDLADQASPLPNGSYSYDSTGAGVTAYVVDTGIDAQVADFGGRVGPGYDAVGDGNGTADCNSHGTHMSGLVGGARYGIAKDVTLVPVRVQGCDYTSSTSRYLAGIDWMIANHQAGTPAVANMSFDEDRSASLDDAVLAATRDGITVVVASGNTGEGHGDDNCQVSPAAASSSSAVLSVGGVQQQADGSPTWYTGGLGGSCIDLLAPAYNIRSDVPGGGTALMSGTSQATALVSGAAALLLQQHPSWSPAQVKAALVADATSGIVDQVPSGVPNRLLNTRDASPAAPATTPPTTAPPTKAPTGAPAPAPKAFRIAWAPKLTGTARVGSTLGTDQGGWIPGATSKQVRWYRLTGTARTLVSSATSYRAQAADLGHRMLVCVTGTRTGYTAATTCSAQSAVVAAGALGVSATPSIAGVPKVGQTVRAVPRTWSPAPVTLRYQWQRVNGRGVATTISGATGASYSLRSSDNGYRVRVLVTGSKGGYTTRTVASVASVAIHR